MDETAQVETTEQTEQTVAELIEAHTEAPQAEAPVPEGVESAREQLEPAPPPEPAEPPAYMQQLMAQQAQFGQALTQLTQAVTALQPKDTPPQQRNESIFARAIRSQYGGDLSDEDVDRYQDAVLRDVNLGRLEGREDLDAGQRQQIQMQREVAQGRLQVAGLQQQLRDLSAQIAELKSAPDRAAEESSTAERVSKRFGAKGARAISHLPELKAIADAGAGDLFGAAVVAQAKTQAQPKSAEWDSAVLSAIEDVAKHVATEATQDGGFYARSPQEAALLRKITSPTPAVTDSGGAKPKPPSVGGKTTTPARQGGTYFSPSELESMTTHELIEKYDRLNPLEQN